MASVYRAQILKASPWPSISNLRALRFLTQLMNVRRHVRAISIHVALIQWQWSLCWIAIVQLLTSDKIGFINVNMLPAIIWKHFVQPDQSSS